jgi:hypothetical protein
MGVPDPRRHRGDHVGKVTEGHRALVRLPLALSRWDLLKGSTRPLGFAVQLQEEELGHFHGSTLQA